MPKAPKLDESKAAPYILKRMAQPRWPRIRSLAEVRHLRPARPLRFPEAAEVPEGQAHLLARMFLFALLRYTLGPEHSVGSDQFVYWNARDPRRCLAPDVFVRLGVKQTPFGSWKTWEQGGAPHLAIEIVSPNEGDGIAWDEKLAHYHEVGVDELVRFDPEEPEGHRLRAWDRVEDDLVERVVADDRTPCLTLGLALSVHSVEGVPGLRLVDDEGRLLPTREEAAEARYSSAAARVRELEEELRRRGE
jgi:Uma2 family endonuclease